MKRGCKVPGCERDYACKGFCNLHYLRWRKYGDPDFAVRGRDPNPPEVCTVPDCHGKHVAKGFCWRHYKQLKRTGGVDEEKANDGRRNRPKIHRGIVSWPTANNKRYRIMTENDEVTTYRINIADLPREFEVGDRVTVSDDGVEMPATILEIRESEGLPNGDISYLYKVECENGKVTFATLPSGALI